MTRLLLVLALGFNCFLVGCWEDKCLPVKSLPDYDSPEYLAVGDSILAWNGWACDNVICHAALDSVLSQYIRSRAVVGTPFSSITGERDIRGQYEEGPWKWVVMTAGANDLRMYCSSNEEGGDTCDLHWACERVLDRLESGMAEFLERILNGEEYSSEKVLIIGYYPFREDASFGFSNCNPYLEDLNSRYSELAGNHPDVYFMDTTDIMNREKPEYFAHDSIHPSPTGARALGQRLAGVLSAR